MGIGQQFGSVLAQPQFAGSSMHGSLHVVGSVGSMHGGGGGGTHVLSVDGSQGCGHAVPGSVLVGSHFGGGQFGPPLLQSGGGGGQFIPVPGSHGGGGGGLHVGSVFGSQPGGQLPAASHGIAQLGSVIGSHGGGGGGLQFGSVVGSHGWPPPPDIGSPGLPTVPMSYGSCGWQTLNWRSR